MRSAAVTVVRTITTNARALARFSVHPRHAAAVGIALAGLAGPARAQFVQSGTLVPGPAATFGNWGTIAAPVSGVIKVDDLKAFATGGASGSNFARIWMALGTQQGGNTAVSSTNRIGYLYIRIDHTGIPEEPTNFNVQLNLGGAPEGRVDHLLTLRPIFSGPNVPSVGRVRIMIKRYSLSASGDYPLLGAFTTSAFANTDSDNGGTINDATAIGWEGVAEDGRNGFEVRIPISWLNGDASRLVMADGSGANTTTTAFFTTGGSFGAVATVRDWLADAAGNNVIVRLNTTSGSSATATGTNLAFGTQPGAANAYATLAPFTVIVRNADNTTSAGATSPVTLSVASGPAGATVGGTATVSAVNGTATFSDIRFSVPGTYTLTASSPGLLSATSGSLIVSATTAAAPTITSVTPSNGQLSVAFTAPANDGGSTITTYQYQLDGGSWMTRASGTTASPLVITGLANGTTYAVRIRAVNGQGAGAQSNAISGTPDNPSPPVNAALPSIGGSAVVGGTLTAAAGTWTGSPAPTFSFQWQRCDASGANCALIIGATTASHVLTMSDTAATMKVVVTATNANGSASASSAASAVVSSLPANVTPPAITGTTEVGGTLSTTAGTWTGSPAPSLAYQWRRCDAAGANCADIAGATSSSYSIAAPDVGATIRVVVTGTNVAGSSSVTSAATTTVTPQPSAPSNSTLPTIVGTAAVGQSLTAQPGSWSGYPTLTFSYQWQRCDAAGAACTIILGATSSSFTLTAADTGATLRVVVTGTNSVSATSASSAQTVVVPGAPTSTSAPVITGTAHVGETLTVTAGSWAGTPAPTLSYQWQRCDAAGSSCAAITGATGTSYRLTDADTGTTVRVLETGATAAGSNTASSAVTAVVTVAPAAPQNQAPPLISGVMTIGGSLTATPGSWSGYPTPTFSYQWQRCDASGASCAGITGATASTYTVVDADLDATIRVVVTATNPAGGSSASSAATALITPAPAAPSNTVSPSITGTASVGQSLTANPGSWTGSPTPTISYQWERCDTAGTACIIIAGATTNSHTLTVADTGSTLRVVVTGTNSVSATSASSAATAVVPGAPTSTGAPTITGTAQVGETLAVTPGSWGGTQATSVAYQWQRCNASGAACADIGGATGTSYMLTTADTASTVRVLETGATLAGSTIAASSATAVVTLPPVTAQPPVNTVAPSITGTAEAGQMLSANVGAWSGTPAPSYTYQWRRCDASGANCADVANATNSTYTLLAGDIGATFRLVVTGTNTAGSTPASSVATVTVTPSPTAPSNSALPTISGTTAVGSSLTAAPGTWSGYPVPVVSYQWQRCDATGANCVDISGATAASYTLTTTDLRNTITVRVTGTNDAGRTTSSSANTQAVSPAPVSATVSHVSIAPTDSVPADGTRSAVVRIELRDASGNPLDGRAADLQLTLAGVAVATVARETAPGVYELELRSSSVNVVTATVSIDGIALGDRPAVSFTKATANVDISMATSTDNPMVGDTVVFTVTVTNHGPDAATGVEVDYPLSPRVRYVAADAARGSYDAATGRWSIGGLALNDSVALKVTVIIIR